MKIGASTLVTYPSGALSGRSEVVAAVPLGDRWGVVTAETPFHPLDHTWPDQPADTGTLDGRPVLDCVTGAVEEGDDTVHVGAGIPVRRGTGGWHWLAVHVMAEPAPVGGPVTLEVDAAARRALSAGHTACHLTALALNAALAGRWRKEVAADGLGSPDFDQTAIAASRILPGGSHDTYRLGKSLRKKGFTAEGLAGDLPAVAAAVNDRLAGWVASGAPVWVDSPGPDLTARRTWHCRLPEGEAVIPCGGTHLTGAGELGAVTVTLDLSPDGTELSMRTAVSA